jgi:hypothetical protein
MNFIISAGILFAKSICMPPKPHVIGFCFPDPNSAWMVDHSSLADIFLGTNKCLVFSFTSIDLKRVTIQNMVCGRKQLA